MRLSVFTSAKDAALDYLLTAEEGLSVIDNS